MGIDHRRIPFSATPLCPLSGRLDMPNSKVTRALTQAHSDHGSNRAELVRLTVRVAPELKRKLQNQAKRAGLPLAEWLLVRLEFGPVNPREARAFLRALIELGKKISAGEARR